MDDYLDSMTMPFGKYKGEYIFDLPIGYLEWLKDNVELNYRLEKVVDRAIDDYYVEKSRRGRIVK